LAAGAEFRGGRDDVEKAPSAWDGSLIEDRIVAEQPLFYYEGIPD
jgi:hypothetical protein